MRQLEITVPSAHSDQMEEIIEEYADDIVISEAEKDGEKLVRYETTVEAENIDELTERLKDIKELDTGDLTISVLEQSAVIEKGKKAEGSSSALSVQEMYSKAISFSSFNKTSWMLIGLASGIASFGIMLENVPVVIGAMVIAPMLSPFISASFGLVIGDKSLIKQSFLYGVISIVFAILMSFAITIPLPARVNSLMLMLSEPSILTILLSLFVGAAAALTFTTDARESLAGVAVAIALVPPSAVAGMTLRMLEFDIFVNVIIVIFTNVISIILAGSIAFKVMGVTPSTYYRKKVSQTQLRRALLLSAVSLIIIGLPVAFLSYQDYQDLNRQSEVEAYLDQQLEGTVMERDVSVERNAISVDLVVVNPGISAERLEYLLERRFDRRVDLKMTVLEGREYGTGLVEGP
jgi:uncharacterized hydrophobic protein (TIGR00341 family)